MLDILRSTTETKDIKVIMMTALSSEDQRARGEALGADRYLVKSQVGIEDVVRAVHEVLADAPVSRPTGPQSFGGAPAPAPGAQPAGARPTTPAVPARPAPAPTPTPSGPQPSGPQPAAAPQPSGLPRPTAPFSTARPANLGDRVIHPITPEPGSKPDLASLMDKELSSADTPAFTPPAPEPSVAPAAPTPSAPAMPPLPTPPTPPVAMPQPTPPVSAPSEPAAPTPAAPQVPDISFEETPRPPAPLSGSQPPSVS
jgi:hypothetical protein